MSSLQQIENNIERIACVPYFSQDNVGYRMYDTVNRVKEMLLEKYKNYITEAWYLDLINDNRQVFFLIRRKSDIPLMSDRKADAVFCDIDQSVGYDHPNMCGAMVYDYEENFLEKSRSIFIEFGPLLDENAVFRII